MIGFWLAAGALALLAGYVLARPLLRPGPAPAEAADLTLYRAQLAEIERDLARGTLAPRDADLARAEVARRLLAADRAAATAAPAAAPGRGRMTALVALALALAGTFLLYDRLGAPGYPDLGLAKRLALADARMAERPSQADAAAQAAAQRPPAPEPDADFAALMTRLRQAVDPATATDLQGLKLLATNEAELGRFAEAEAAQRRLIAVRGAEATAGDHVVLAEILIRSAGGYVSPEAEAALTDALALDATNGAARYYAGEMFNQGGRYDRAFAVWSGLLADSPADAPWVAPILGRMPDTAARAGVAWTPPDTSTPEEQAAMIEGMVAGLSERLAAEGGPAEDWARLIRSLGVLGRKAEAQAIYDEAKAIFAGMEVELSGLAEAAVGAGLAR